MANQEPNEKSYILLGETKPATTATEDDTKSVASSESSKGTSKPKTSSMPVTSVNFINSVVGSGVMAIPYALRQAGLGLGITMVVILCLVTCKSLILQIAAAKAVGTTTYQETVELVFGRTGFFLCAVVQFFFPFLAMVSYNIIIGDTITKVIVRITDVDPGNFWVQREFVMTMVTLIVTLPLSSLRNIVYLSNTSLLSLTMICFIGISMMVRAPVMMEFVQVKPDPIKFIDTGVGSAIGIISFSFVCHQSTFLLYKSLENNTEQRWNRVTYLSLSLSVLLCLVIGVSGYVPFRSHTQGDVLENYCKYDDLMNACRMVFAMTVMFTYPLECFASREVLDTTFFRNSETNPLWRHILVTIGIVGAALLLSFTTDCISIVLQLAGIFLGGPLAFFIPPATFIRTRNGPIFSKETIEAWLVILFGIVASLAGFITMIIDWYDIAECSHGVEMDYCFVNGTTTPISFNHPNSPPRMLLSAVIP